MSAPIKVTGVHDHRNRCSRSAEYAVRGGIQVVFQFAKKLVKGSVSDATWKRIQEARRKTTLSFSKVELHEKEMAIDPFVEFFGGLEGKSVLEVGASGSGDTVARIKKVFGAKQAVGINLAFMEKEQLFEGCWLEPADIRNTPYENNYFDEIFSNSAFEHIQDLDKGLSEMFRILKPGGRLIARFGPIWSSSYGHHLWLNDNKTLYNYWNVKLPPYCHLLMKPNELYDHCKKTITDSVTTKIVDFVFESDEQNQYFFEDYERMVSESPFKTIYFKGYDHPQLANLYRTKNIESNLIKLKELYGENRQFMFDGIEIMLKKEHP
jgi:ubiquinone/menaquinone biosynthesis C-methylase UbiE